jgi:hypothetical protein
MNLSGFVEPSWMQHETPTLRVVLKPSFHPELCITVGSTANAAMLSVVALAEQFWARRGEVYLPSDREQVQLSASVFEEVLALFDEAHRALDPYRRHVFCDGMGSEACLVSRAGTRRLIAHVSAQRAADRFIARLIELAWSDCHQPRVLNALAQAAWYLNVKYPLRDVPPVPPVTRLAILGTAQDRHEYFEMLRRHKKDVA